jgi:hypothetical protein
VVIPKERRFLNNFRPNIFYGIKVRSFRGSWKEIKLLFLIFKPILSSSAVGPN